MVFFLLVNVSANLIGVFGDWAGLWFVGDDIECIGGGVAGGVALSHGLVWREYAGLFYFLLFFFFEVGFDFDRAVGWRHLLVLLWGLVVLGRWYVGAFIGVVERLVLMSVLLLRVP